MARVKGGMNAKQKHNKVLKLAKGYRGARSKQYRVAKQSVMRALTSSYAGRKQRKRQFRQLWIARINAAARMTSHTASLCMVLSWQVLTSTERCSQRWLSAMLRDLQSLLRLQRHSYHNIEYRIFYI